MTEQQNRARSGTRPALVIDGEAVVIGRKTSAKPREDTAQERRSREPSAGDTFTARAAFGRARPQAARRRKPATPDLVFQSAPKQRFAMPAEQVRSVLPRAAWITGLVTLAVLLPLAVLSVYDGVQGGGKAVATASPLAFPIAEKPVRILYGTPGAAQTRLASAGESRPATLPGTLGGVYPVSAGVHPAGVARLGTARSIPDMKAAARRTP